jgi:iron complex transport system permease protein
VFGIFVSLGVFAIQVLAFFGELLAGASVYAVDSALRARDYLLADIQFGAAFDNLVGVSD